MTTTIQVSIATKQMLDFIKKKEHIPTYDSLLQKILHKHAEIPHSMFGVYKGMKKWKKEEDRMNLHEL